MRKTKNPRRSRIIRKWDGTPVAEIAETSDLMVNGVTPSTGTPRAKRPAEGEELIFGFVCEDELSSNT